jgi:glycosyltransferase involved in cell wall biosynthesis
MKIWLISIFEQTPVDNVFSTRFISIANESVNRGHEVSFFGSTFKHNTKIQRFEETTEIEENENYRLIFVKSDSYSENISLKRLMVYNKFSNELLKVLKNREEMPDIILMAFPPISMSYKVSKWAKEKNIPLIIDIIDPWPDLFKTAVPKSLRPIFDLSIKGMRTKVANSFKNATHVTAISKQYLEWAEKLAEKRLETTCFYPASDLEFILNQINRTPEKSKEGFNELVVIYAGSLASSYDIPCILGAADILEEKYGDKIKFKIAGAGPQEKLINSYITKHSNLEFLGRLVKDDLMKQYSLSHLGMTQHIKGAPQSVTYKLFDLLSSGLPILNSLESEMKNIIVDEKVGLHNDPGNAKQLVENIEVFYKNPNLIQEFRENGFRLTKEKGDTKTVYKNFVDLLEAKAK